MDFEKLQNDGLIALAADVVAAYVANNRVPSSEVAELIFTVYNALNALSASEPAEPETVALFPAVPIKKSVTADYIVCLEDGKHFKSMKRHLQTKFGMTPDEYRRKWGLPSGYPMVAAGYSEKRSALALSLGLGRKKVEPVAKLNRGRKAAAMPSD